ncbi:uncharacterized protein F4812DRAFT_456534 [Daldinia caldariorum]|uniref:uncharacterized protein n=1 Tax=Daldinia caldariorum TaxID=326644 RepID=UPI00200843F0|nr:uncharacterized protein F4812DRAFT_456534 [Daldinia caldariorum]KAI1470524.1 hypothetical protein F4812DRAFT_456534 [Daldinia caldariorum]
MPSLDEISHSRGVMVAAVREYYDFLTEMYLKELDVIEPPEGLAESYHQTKIIKQDGQSRLATLPPTQQLGHQLASGQITGETLRLATEGASIYVDVPPYFVSLTSGGRNNPVFLLDTKFCVAHWYEAPGEVRYEPSREPIEDGPYDYAPEKEAEWRDTEKIFGITIDTIGDLPAVQKTVLNWSEGNCTEDEQSGAVFGLPDVSVFDIAEESMINDM